MSTSRDDPLVKFVVVGDEDVGKTCLVTVFMTDRFPTGYIPPVFESMAARPEVDGQPYILALWDTAGRDRFRPLSYPSTDVFLLCFSLADSESYENVETRWYPELSAFCPDVPIILVGTKLDLREDKEAEEKGVYVESVSMQEGLKMQAKNDNVVKYLECSAFSNFGVKEVFDEAARTALKCTANTQSQRNRCVFL